MNDFEGILSSDYGFKPQGKSAPMSSRAPSYNKSTSSSLNFDLGSRDSSNFSDSIFTSKLTQNSQTIDDLGNAYAAPPRRVEKSENGGPKSAFDFDSMFNAGSNPSSRLPAYDKPVYDEDIFDGVPGMKTSSSSGVKYDNVFEIVSNISPTRRSATNSGLDEFLGGSGNRERQQLKSKKDNPAMSGFDDLIPGFGRSSPTKRSAPNSAWSSAPTTASAKTTEDCLAAPTSGSRHPISSSGASVDPLEEFNVFGKYGGTKTTTKSNPSSVPSGIVFDELDPFDGLQKSVPSSSPDDSTVGKDRKPFGTQYSNGLSQHHNVNEHSDKFSKKTAPADNDLDSHQNIYNTFSASGYFYNSIHSHEEQSHHEANISAEYPPTYEDNTKSPDEVWLLVSEIPLFTQPTRAPPPSRPPPPRPARATKFESGSFGSTNVRKENDFSPSAKSTQHFENANSAPDVRSATVDELEDFSMGRTNGYNIHDNVNSTSGEELDMKIDAAASAAAMKVAMDRAEAKFRHAKEVMGRQSARAVRNRESAQLEKDENWLDVEERALREKQERLEQERFKLEREEKAMEQKRLEKEREMEEKEKEQQRLEKEREREIVRVRARQAVERANREARERAAAEAQRKAERAAVEKANAEARQRAERSAVLRAQAEACERAAADARERAERAVTEAREREAEARARAEKSEAAEAREKESRERAAESRRRAERATVERAAAEARERAAAEARERAAATARAKQQSSDNDLESFFSMGRASSAPRPRANFSDPMFNGQSPNRKEPDVARTSASTANMRKASSSTNIVDDLSSIFGGANMGVSTSGEFQEVEGESEERRRARLERHQRTQERAAKALAEKNERDLHVQREQAERHRIGESLDAEIKRWAAGKEGNLRALLSTLQYVLWPECGWQPVSLTDLITAAAVKKVYRKATLCIHPDKVQQKGANLQQKYVAEKVFDLLKEAWNKLNSEELF
ncbi:hypothetical protein SAY87_002314 [Trapa incisa]|uniref:J domain-containing protein n=1 Tax=Trapa incisa TaxID=236973 RepID=A0AAN7JWR6_9MYRT|nr:hypothetical protein SAY87_002314 [Trapa incisa]